MANEKIFTDIQVVQGTASNRIVMAPLTRGRAGPERVPNEIMRDYYSQRAGAGMIITEATSISEEGLGWNESPGIYTDAMTEGWKLTTEAVKAKGTPIVLQLWHCGRASHSDFHGGELPFAPSAVKLEGDEIHTPKGKKAYEVPQAMSKADIQRTIDDYRKAAERAKAAGFSGVEVHGANGYLINQFLDTRSNQRSDEYGGSVENRFRFFREIIEAVSEVWDKASIGARISPNGVFNDMGHAEYQETFRYVAEQLNALEIGYLHVMDGLAFGFHGHGDAMQLSTFRELYKGVLMGNCGYDFESAKAAINAGHADMIAIGRPFIANPDLVDRYKNGYELTAFDDMSKWYTPGPEGYSDYPNYQAS